MTLIADEVYADLAPVAEGDAQRSYALRAFVRALGSMFAQPEEAVRALGDGLDSWERIWDADLTPAWLLPFAGQAVGVMVDTGVTVAEQRAQIKAEGGWHRGRPSSMLAAVALTLTGSKRIRLVERNAGAWSLLLITSPGETPNATATKNAALSQKPGGIILTTETSDLPLIDEGTKTIDASTGTIDTAKLSDVT